MQLWQFFREYPLWIFSVFKIQQHLLFCNNPSVWMSVASRVLRFDNQSGNLHLQDSDCFVWNGSCLWSCCWSCWMAWDRWHSSLLSTRAGAIENTSALPLCWGEKLIVPWAGGALSSYFSASKYWKPGLCTGTLWASLGLTHYHFLTVSSCPFLELKLHFWKLTLFFFSF